MCGSELLAYGYQDVVVQHEFFAILELSSLPVFLTNGVGIVILDPYQLIEGVKLERAIIPLLLFLGNMVGVLAAELNDLGCSRSH